MANIYNTQPNLACHWTRIVKTRETTEGRLAITVNENIFRPAGGGQPQDFGTLTAGHVTVPVGKVFRADGETWLEVDGVPRASFAVGASILLSLDVTRRHNLSRCHSLTHLGMAVVKEFLSGYESKGADILDDATSLTLFFRGAHVPDLAMLCDIDSRMRSLVFDAIPVTIEKARSLEAAERVYAKWRVDPDNQLTGRVRVVHIEGVDANPCSGSHVAHTGEIGPFEVRGCRVDGRGLTALSLRRLDVWMSW